MKNLPPLFCVRFYSRLRTPTTAEVIAREESFAAAEKIVWGDKSPIALLSVDDKGMLSSRGETQKEKLMRAFDSTKDYLEAPSLTAHCVYMNGGMRTLAEDEARAVKQNIDAEQNFLTFADIDNDAMDSQTLMINPVQIDTMNWSKNIATFTSKHDSTAAQNRCTTYVDHISKEALLQELRRAHLSFEMSVTSAHPGFPETVYFKNIAQMPTPSVAHTKPSPP